MRRRAVIVLIICGLAVGLSASANGHTSQYCQEPDQASAFLASSSGVSCAVARKVVATLTSTCYGHDRCVAQGFRCVAYWDGQAIQLRPPRALQQRVALDRVGRELTAGVMPLRCTSCGECTLSRYEARRLVGAVPQPR